MGLLNKNHNSHLFIKYNKKKKLFIFISLDNKIIWQYKLIKDNNKISLSNILHNYMHFLFYLNLFGFLPLNKEKIYYYV